MNNYPTSRDAPTGISISILIQNHFNRAGGRTSNVGLEQMTRSKYSWIKNTVGALFALLVIIYLVWAALPFNESVRVHNSAGISDEDVVEVIAYAKTQGAFSSDDARRLKSESLWTPWRRGFFFIEIGGNSKQIGVRAGFIGGPLYGGGPVFSGEKKSDGWHFEDRGFWMS